MRFCGPDGRWTGSSPKCEEVRCDAPGLPVNGSAIYIGNDRSFKEQSFSVGVTVQYECDYGHVVKGSWSSRLCQANGDWSGEPPICKFVDCGTPPSIENGNYVLKHPPAGSVGSATPIESNRRSDSNVGGQSGTFTYYGTIAHYSCDANYKLQGPAQRECLDTGQWRAPLPTCESVQCPKPEHFDEFTQVSLVTRSASASASSTESTTAANSGDQQSLARSIRLIANNQWINHDSSQTFGVGDKLYYSCVPGFELYGGPDIRTCTQYGQWSGSSTPRCRLIDCGRPAPIGQEGRFYLLNESTTFNSLVEYSCVRPFKLVEMKIRQAGNLIETLNVAQAGVTPILTSLPIGVKVCANNGQWMPNDQQPKCVSASSDGSSLSPGSGGVGNGGGQFDGGDNSLDSSQRVQVLAGSTPTTTFIGAIGNNHDGSDNNLDSASGHHQTQPASTSLWAKVIIAICLMVMLALIILTLICIRSGKKPKQTHRTSILTNGHPAAAAAAAAAMHIQLASGGVVGGAKTMSQQQAVAAAQQASMMAGSNVYINGTAHKMFPAQMIHQMPALQSSHPHMNPQALMNQQGLAAYGDASASLSHNQEMMLAAAAAANSAGRSMVTVGGGVANGGEILANNKSSSLGMVGDRVVRTNQLGDHPMSMSTMNMMDSYSRLSIESELQSANQQTNKTIRHNPNGLVTFVSPAQQQQNRNGQQQQQLQQQQGTSSQHQVSPQSISTSLSLSSSSSPSSSSSAHHTTATRLSTTDSASSSSSSSNNNNNNNISNGTNRHNGYQPAQQYASGQVQQPSPPSLPAHPPPSHRLQQHHKQTVKQQNQPLKQPITGRQSQSQQNRSSDQSSQQQPTGNHHYMEPAL